MTKYMEKRKRRKENQKVDESLKVLRIKEAYDISIEQYIKLHDKSYEGMETVEVPIDWLKQFIIDFIVYNQQEGKERKGLQGAVFGAVLYEHNCSAQLFLRKAGYVPLLDDGKVTIEKKKAEKKVSKKPKKDVKDKKNKVQPNKSGKDSKKTVVE